MQSVIESQIRKKIENKEHQDVLLGILLGNDDGITKDIKEDFRRSSLSHILAVSGMHVAYVITFVDYMLNKLNIGKRKIKIITVLFLAFFVLLTNNTPSVRRACIMAGLSTVAMLINQKSDIINNMAVALFITLIQNPFSIFNTGLILSYSATLGIIVLMPILLKKEGKVISIITTSICAQIAILPITIMLFQNISLTFIFSNIIISFLIGIIIMFGFAISIPINIPILPIILDILLFALTKVSEFFASIPLSHILVCTPNIIFVICYYIVLLFFIYIKKINKKEYKRRFEKRLLTNVDKFKSFIYKEKIKAICWVCILTICIVLINKIPGNLEISFIDVGQGDCTLITSKGRKKHLD